MCTQACGFAGTRASAVPRELSLHFCTMRACSVLRPGMRESFRLLFIAGGGELFKLRSCSGPWTSHASFPFNPLQCKHARGLTLPSGLPLHPCTFSDVNTRPSFFLRKAYSGVPPLLRLGLWPSEANFSFIPRHLGIPGFVADGGKLRPSALAESWALALAVELPIESSTF